VYFVLTSRLAPTFFEKTKETEEEEEKSKQETIISSLPQTDVHPRECFVCNEKFETFWDEDEEEWMMRDATLHDGNVRLQRFEFMY
jgi:hypothetical protein